jgi:hypothetical protein
MTGFPLEFRDEVLGPPSEDGCPLSDQAVAQYLKSCAYYILDDEPPLTYGPPTLALHRVIEGRGFWIWTTTDRTGAPWFVVAAAARADETRWAFAETQDDRTAEEFLQDTLREMNRAA